MMDFVRGNDPFKTLEIGEYNKYKQWLKENHLENFIKNGFTGSSDTKIPELSADVNYYVTIKYPCPVEKDVRFNFSGDRNLKVININLDNILTSKQIKFTEDVILSKKDEPHRGSNAISLLLNHIPVFILNVQVFDDIKDHKDLYGFYTRVKLGYGRDIPSIYLCLDKIKKKYKEDEEFKYIVTAVIIHEFAHALMDLDTQSLQLAENPLFKWLEEPMAELITLQICNNYAGESKFLDVVKEMIFNSPDNYKLGYYLYKYQMHNSWWNWSTKKNKILECATQMNMKADEFQDISAGVVDEFKLKNLFKKLNLKY